MDTKLPNSSYIYLPTCHCIGIIDAFQDGYVPYPLDISSYDGKTARCIVDRLNELEGVTPAQASAMAVGSMFGWHVPGADPDNYNPDGTPKRKEC